MASNGPDCPPNNANSKQPRQFRPSPLTSLKICRGDEERLDRSVCWKVASIVMQRRRN